MVRVVADLGRQVEGHREAGRPLGEEIPVALVRLRGAGVAGVLAHGPVPLAVHVRVEPAGVGVPRDRPPLRVGDPRHVLRPVEALDGDPGGGLARSVTSSTARRGGGGGLGGHGGIV